jgi:SAM-dependent methyltransferase
MAGVELIEDIKCYAPELAFHNKDFPSESFENLFVSESRNFWFISRNKVIRRLVEKYVSEEKNSKKKYLEIGCGTGFVLMGLSELKYLELTGAEIYLQGLKYARKRLPEIEFIQLDATNLPFKSQFHAIGAFDVLEHIEFDELVIKNVYNALQTNGLFFISVPQYMWMWSSTDDFAFHKRRYTRRELKEKLITNGFKIQFISSFLFTLFPFMALSRFVMKFKKKKNVPVNDNSNAPELNINPFINSIFSLAMKFDEFLIGMGISLPFGGSLIVVAKKISDK